MAELTFYDREGIPVAYSEDEETIYRFSGEPVAYFVDEAVYSFDGKHLGHFAEGWIRDHYGKCIFFTEEAHDGPVKPSYRSKPHKDLKGMRPRKEMRDKPWITAMKSNSWSKLSGPQFFPASESEDVEIP